jgi:hypothetical protein
MSPWGHIYGSDRGKFEPLNEQIQLKTKSKV